MSDQAKAARRNMERADFESAARYLHSGSQFLFLRDGSIDHMLFGFTVDTDHQPVGIVPVPCAPLFDPRFGSRGKDAVAMVMGKMLASGDFDLVALLSEVWTVSRADKDPPISDVSSQPDRKEAVMAVIRSKDYTTMAHWLIERPARRLVWAPPNFDAEFVGRFTGPRRSMAS